MNQIFRFCCNCVSMSLIKNGKCYLCDETKQCIWFIVYRYIVNSPSYIRELVNIVKGYGRSMYMCDYMCDYF